MGAPSWTEEGDAMKRKGLFPKCLVAGLSAALIAVTVWGLLALERLSEKAAEGAVKDPPYAQDTTARTDPAETVPSQPPTAEQIVEDFAAQHGLTLADYPEELIQALEREPELEEFVLNYPLEHGKEHAIDISGYAYVEGVPLFLQWDRQWGYKDYVGSVAGVAGCGPTCMSMVVYHFTRDPAMHPGYMMDLAQSDRTYANEAVNTQWAFFSQGGKELGLTVEELTKEQIQDPARIAQVLDQGKVIVANVGPGVFTDTGHYLVIWGHEDGAFRINDPFSLENSQRLWSFDEFDDQIKMMWAFSK